MNSGAEETRTRCHGKEAADGNIGGGAYRIHLAAAIGARRLSRWSFAVAGSRRDGGFTRVQARATQLLVLPVL